MSDQRPSANDAARLAPDGRDFAILGLLLVAAAALYAVDPLYCVLALGFIVLLVMFEARARLAGAGSERRPALVAEQAEPASFAPAGDVDARMRAFAEEQARLVARLEALAAEHEHARVTLINEMPQWRSAIAAPLSARLDEAVKAALEGQAREAADREAAVARLSAHLDEGLGSANERVAREAADREAAETRLAAMLEAGLSSASERLALETADLEAAVARLEEGLATSSRTLEELRSAAEAQRQAHDRLAAMFEIRSETLDAVGRSVTGMEAGLAQGLERITALDAGLDEHREAHERLAATLDTRSETLDSVGRTVAGVEAELARGMTQLEGLSRTVGQAAQIAEERAEQLRTAEQALERLGAEIAAGDRRLGELEAMIATISDLQLAEQRRLEDLAAAQLDLGSQVGQSGESISGLSGAMEGQAAESAALRALAERLGAEVEAERGRLAALEAANSGLAAELAKAREELTQSVERRAAEAMSAAGVERERLDQFGQSLATVTERWQQDATVLKGTVDQLAAVKSQADQARAALRKMNASNAARARPHMRMLETGSAQKIIDEWMPRLGLTLPASALYYLAHQTCLDEDRCEGRIATSIEAALLRVLLLRSVPRKSVGVLEIGTLFGVGAGILSRHRGDAIERVRLTVVDPLSGYYGAKPDPVTGLTVDEGRFMRNLETLGVRQGDLTLLDGFSTDPRIVRAASRRKYDYLLIDGDHSGAGVTADFQAYAPFVRNNGIVVFDDYDVPEWPEIKPAVDALLQDAPEWDWLGADWRTAAVRKRRTAAT